MKRLLNMWTTLALAIVLAWGASYFAPVASAADKPERISVAYCVDCVQFHFQDKDGKADGLIIDMWRLWSERTGIAVDFKAATWEETLRMVGDGRADAHAGLFFNEERAKFLEYGTSLTKTDTQFFVHKDLPGIEKVEDLTAYKVGVLSGDYVEGFLKKKLPPENIVGFESYEAIMEALREGRLQVFAADTPTGIFHLQKSGLGYVFEAPASEPLYTEKWFVAATKGNTELIKIINAGMALVSKSERREIERRWASISDPVVFDAEKTNKRLNLTVQERQWLADHPVISVHNETGWPPFNFFDDAKPQGFSIDYMNLLASMIGVKVDYVTGPTWNEFLGLMKSGDLDVMLNIVNTPERQKYLLFTKPYAFNPNTILSRRETPYDDLEQLFGKTVALPKGFFYEEILKRDYPGIKLHLVKNMDESMKAVAFGKADAALGELAVFNYLLGREMMTGLALSGEVKPGGASYSQLNIATRKDLPVLASILMKAMDAVAPEEVKVLRQRWIDIATTAVPKAVKLKLTDGEKAWLAEHKHIRLGVDPAYPPFEFVGKDGTYSGMASDYVQLISERLGIVMEVVPNLSWQQVIDGLKAQTLDVLPAVVKTPEREPYMNFSRSHMAFPIIIVTQEDYSFVSGLNDLNGRKVALMKGYAVTGRIETQNPGIERHLFDLPLQALRAVAVGKVEATVLNLAVATYLIKKNNLNNLKVASPADINLPGLSFAVRKDWPEFIPILEKALASITPEEEIAIRSMWVAVSYETGIDIMLALQIGGAGAVIFIFIVLWNRRLSREVKQRKQAEAALSASERRLHGAVDSLQGGFALYDAEDRLVLVNDQYAQINPSINEILERGGTFEDVLRANVAQGTIAEAVGREEEFLRERLARHRNPSAEPIVRNHTNGRSYLLREVKTPEGGIVLTYSEITELKRAEVTLRDQHRFIELLHGISEASNEAVTVDDAFKVCLDEICADTGWPVGHVYVLNPGQEVPLESSKVWHLAKPRKFTVFRRITEATGFRLGEGLPGRVLESRKAAWIRDVTEDENFPRAKQAKDIGVRAGFAFPVSLGDQVLAVFEFFSERAEDPDQHTLDILAKVGLQLGGVIARKRAEEELRRQTNLLNNILESAGQGIVAYDADQRIIAFNKNYKKIWPLSEEILKVGATLHDVVHGLAELGFHGEGDQEAWAEERVRVLTSGKATSSDIRAVDRIAYHALSQPRSDGGLVVTYTDITDRRRTEETLQEAYGIIKDQRDRMEDELNIGREIQMSMIPLEFPPFPDHDEFSIYATLKPAREVGGDFYDFYFLDEERLCICIGDVSGKGFPSALFMAMAKTLIKSRADDDRSTASILTHVNDELSADNRSAMFVTICAGIINIRTGELVYTNAGHNPPYLKRIDGTLQRLDQRHGPVVGALEGMVYKEDRDTMAPGDLLALYTDGVTEAMDVEDQLYSEDRYAELLGRTEAGDPETLVGNTLAAIETFTGGAEQTDDVTLLALKFHGTPEDGLMAEQRIVIKNELPEIIAVNEKFETFAEVFKIPRSVAVKFNVIFDELLSNVISYAYTDDEHDIEVRMERAGKRLTVTITDDGVPFNPLSVERPDTDLSLEDREFGGMGIHLVRNLVDDVSYQRRIGKNVMTMMQILEQKGGAP